MQFPKQIYRARDAILAGCFVFAASGLPVHAAKAPKADAQSSAPVLMSRTGGGNSWADLKELEAAAAKGNPKAEAQLGEMLLRGDGISKNEVRAVRLLEKAARAGESSAAFRIGMLLMNGESGVVKDPVRALEYFRAAAAGGEKEAFFNIGAAHASGRGVKRDYGEALGWLIVARKHGADPSTENALRTQIKSQASWIAKGERRAKEIEAEFAGKKVAELLPPAHPLDAIAEAPTPTGPTNAPSSPSQSGPVKPKVELRPATPPKPELPGLPPPSIKP
jgi:hypothetical protein